jgi:hypothetical protein
MTAARYLPGNDYGFLKTASADLVEASGRGQRAAAKTRVGQQHLSKCCSDAPEFEEVFLPLDVVADLEAACGKPIITAALADLSGHVLVKAPEILRNGSKLGRLTAEALKEIGDVFSELGNILDDDKVAFPEADAFDRQADEAIGKLLALKLQVRAEAEAKL